MVGELEDIRYARPRETAAIARENRDVVAGVKVRLGSGACGDNVDAALDAALEAAELAETPLMAHIAEGADLRAVLPRLRPGDIVTHAFTASGPGILGDDGRILPEAHDARRRGVRFDVGHGCGSFSWGTAAQALAEGLGPDSISTDLHRYSIERPVVDLPTTMSRYLALGLSLGEVVAATTSGPAAILGRSELGTLRPGSPADVSVLRLDTTPVELPDSQGTRRTVPTRLVPVMTIAAGALHRASDVELPPPAVSRRRPGGRLLGPDLTRRAQEIVAQAEPLELDAVGIRVGMEDRADLVPAQRDEVRIAAHTARFVEGLRPGRVQLAERRPRLAGIAGQADADAALRRDPRRDRRRPPGRSAIGTA